MAAAEDERTGTIEAADQLQDMAGACGGEGRQSEKKREEKHQRGDGERRRNMHGKWRGLGAGRPRKQLPTDETAGNNGADLPAAEGTASASSVAPIARVARSLSGHKLRAMPQTAWATTATATILRPCSQGTCEMSPSSATPYSKAIMATAEGIVNPNQAANAPARPARSVPSVMPTWLLAGPGKN